MRRWVYERLGQYVFGIQDVSLWHTKCMCLAYKICHNTPQASHKCDRCDPTAILGKCLGLFNVFMLGLFNVRHQGCGEWVSYVFALEAAG